MKKITLFGALLSIMLGFSTRLDAQLFSEDFGTAFGSISTVNWPTGCRSGASSFNTSVSSCAGAGDYAYSLSGFGSYVTTLGIAIPAAGYTLDFSYSFNNAFSFPTVEIRTGASCGITLANTETLTNTSGSCTPHSINLDAYAGQTIYLRFRSNTSSATFYIDDIVVDVGTGGGGPTCLLQDDFGTAFTSISTTNWPSGCRSGASSFNTSTGPCSGAGDYSYAMNGFVYVTSMALSIPSTGFTCDFNYSFNQTFSFPSVEIRTGASCGSSLSQTVTLTNTSGVCTPHSINLDAYAGQTIYLRFRSNSSLATVYFDDIEVCGNTSGSFSMKWADNFNDNDLTLDFTGNDGDEDCPACGPWVLGGGATFELVPAAGWNGNTNKTEAFPISQPNVYYVRLDRNEWIESPVIDMSNAENLKISFYAKSSSPGTGGGDQWSFSDRLRLQIWDGSSWITVQSMRDDLSATWTGPDDFISAALPFNYYCFTAYKDASSPGNYYYTGAPNVDPSYFHSGFKFRVLFEGGFSGSPFAWVDDFTFRADNDGYSTMIPCGVSFWNQPAATGYGQDPGATSLDNSERGVELELDNSINIPPDWMTEADDGDAVTQVFGAGESERVVFCVLCEEEINFAFPKVHFYAPSMGWQSSVMSKDNSYSGPGWKYYAVEYISCDLAGGSIAEPTTDYQYYFSFEYGNEFIPVFYQLNTSGIEYGGGVTSSLETFNAPDVVSSNNCGLLPVSWLSFSGDHENGQTNLFWETTNEFQNDGFEIQRMINRQPFEKIGWVEGRNQGAALASYTFIDPIKALNGDELIYRLRQIDKNGTETFSPVVHISVSENENNYIQIYPNPTSGRITLTRHGKGWEEATVLVSDLRGRTIFQKTSLFSTNSDSEVLDLQMLPKGLYLVKIHSNQHTSTSKMIIK